MKVSFFAFFLFLAVMSTSQTPVLKQSIYRAVLHRPDHHEIVFNFEPKKENGKTVLYVINDTERLRVNDVTQKGDSLFFNMPVFESSFFSIIHKDGSLRGTWLKGTSREPQRWVFTAVPGQPFRFPLSSGPAKHMISGKWKVVFTNTVNGKVVNAIAIFKQRGNKLGGSFLTPSGDYRYLEGVVTGDSLMLSTFDGSHAYYFSGRIDSENKISSGHYFAGYAGLQTWSAVKDNDAVLPEQRSPMSLKPGETGLNFAFRDLDDQLVSIRDSRFKDKVVIVQIMGSWCPNCMDETKFLSDFYHKNKQRGVEIVALAYEYSTDRERSKKSLRKFRERFNVEYPMLITGVASDDELLTEKTLPELTPIRSFPTTIFIDRKGNVRKIESVFYGPGTGEYYADFLRGFEEEVGELVREK